MSTPVSSEDPTGIVSAQPASSEIDSELTLPKLQINIPAMFDVQPLGTALDFSATDGQGGPQLVLASLQSETDPTLVVSSGYQPQPGVYTVVVTASDRSNKVIVSSERRLVVYDPGGFATGSGRFMSAAHACPEGSICSGISGRVNFSFLSKYKKLDKQPTGNTQFTFAAGGVNFQSSSNDWLVVSHGGKYAQFKGSGSINGDEGYEFLLWAGDGLGSNGEDTFRIKIWSDDEGVVYDNGFNQEIGGGNIKVHK